MSELISMLDFVLNNPSSNAKLINYANFLKQPLKKGMFVTCDENENVLDAFVHIVEGGFSLEYQQAKERVLFEGFVFSNNVIYNGNTQIYITDFTEEKPLKIQISTIEALVKYNLTLTATAIKELGL